jgi:holo-[acyl-carrier protein] synthase
MRLQNGVDLIEIERVRDAIERFGSRFLQRIFTPAELGEVGTSPASLAARFAAKEAVAKALGTGIGAISWQEIEILRCNGNQPGLSLHGAAARLAAEQGLNYWSLSLSHSQTHAIAVVMAVE